MNRKHTLQTTIHVHVPLDCNGIGPIVGKTATQQYPADFIRKFMEWY